ncbi:MAG: PH domain-containing protein [Geodermatophilaceae bacterium]
MPDGDRFDRYLLPEERRILEFIYHWMFLAKPAAAFAAAVAVGFAVLRVTQGATGGWVLFVLALAGTGLPLLAAIENRAVARLIITDTRVVFVEGWWTKRYGMMPLSKITDVTIEQSLLGRILRYGTLYAESPGQDQALSKVAFLPDPLTAWHTISDLLYVQGAGRPGFQRPGADRRRNEPDRYADPDGYREDSGSYREDSGGYAPGPERYEAEPTPFPGPEPTTPSYP